MFSDEYGDEQIPYMSPPTAAPKNDSSDVDEEEYSSLVQAKKVLDEGFEKLKYDLTEVDEKNEDSLALEIASRKKARAIIEPVKQLVDQAVEAVQVKRKGK